jgi:hypothetical protein
MHRLVQEGFLGWLGPEKAFEAFRSAVKILYLAFPQHKKGMGLRNHWPACNLGMSHVLALASCYRRYCWPSVFPGDLDTLLELIKSCGWYVPLCCPVYLRDLH